MKHLPANHRILLIATSLLLALGAFSLPALEARSNTSYLAFALSRAAPRVECVVEQKAAFLVRSDRDVQDTTYQLRPATGQTAGRWTASLWPIRPTANSELPDLKIPPERDPDWRISREITASGAHRYHVASRIPRSDFRNSLLLLEPHGDALSVSLKVEAAAVSEAVRLEWLLKARSTLEKGPPDQLTPLDPDEVRQLVQHLTDDEVRQWTGISRRNEFLQVWQRMNQEQIDKAFAGPETMELWPEPHPILSPPIRLLPGGYYFVGGARAGS
jgi:hypothetical protein